jgi:hypothetical protein
MSDNAAEANPARVSGAVFAIDRGAFRCAAVGGLNAAVPSGLAARGICCRKLSELSPGWMSGVWKFNNERKVGDES